MLLLLLLLLLHLHATTLPPIPSSLQVSADFQPFYPTLATDVFATRWLTSSGDQLFLIINRSGKDWPSLPLLEISAPVGSAVINCYSGETIIPSTTTTDFTAAAAAEAAGFACVWAGSGTSAPSSAFLSSMASLTNTPLADLSNTWVAAHTVAPPHASTPIPAQPPPGMLLVPGGVFNFTTDGIEIEGPDGYGVDFQFPWENVTQRTHTQLLQMPPLWVDEYPVTNSQWSEYMNASSYVPADDTYYLAFWSRAGFNMSGDDGYRPVTWVSPQEAAGAHGALRPNPPPFCTFHMRVRLLCVLRPPTAARVGVAVRRKRTQPRFRLPLGRCPPLRRQHARAAVRPRPPPPRSR